VEVAERARETARAADADLVVSIGGGSTTGTAKAIALELGTPIAAVPTTYAGSEVTPIWGLTEAGRKQTGRSLAVLPKLVLYDPELTVSLPPQVTGPSGLNAIAHCIEAFYAPAANPITSLIAEEGIRLLAAGLPVAVAAPDDLDARGLMLLGAYLAGSSFAVAGSGLHHKICHALGGAFDLPHAETHGVVLPQVLAFNEPALGQSAARIRTALGAEAGESGALATFDLLEEVGAPTSLAAIGLPEGGIEQVLDEIVAASPAGNPRPVERDDVEALLLAAYEGRRPQGS
jgi:maleylacetate reductase